MRKRKLYFGARRRNPAPRPFHWEIKWFREWLGGQPRSDIHIGHVRDGFSETVYPTTLLNSGLNVTFQAPPGDVYQRIGE